MAKLSIVPKTEPPKAEKIRQRLGKQPRPACILQCRCGSREVFEARIGVEFINGRVGGGTKVLLCVACHRNGQRVVVG